MRGWLRNCYIKSRREGECMFVASGDTVIARLQGYAVVPVEDYLDLLPENEQARFLMDVHVPLLPGKSGYISPPEPSA